MSRAVVIPTYNEAENIKPLVEAIQAALPGLAIIIVDDGSPDGTGDIAEALTGVTVIRRAGKLGLGSAYVTGFQHAIEAGFKQIGGMDADFSHDPAVLPDLFGMLETYDIAIGARYIPGGGVVNWSWRRRFLSRNANRIARWALRLPASDMTSAFRAYSRDALAAVGLDEMRCEGYAFLVELLYRCWKKGYTIGETPIMFHDRERGASKLDRSEIVKGALNLLRLRFGR